ncbi:hypothetical protein L209DRAFT_163030 [Thermothelomyces heterothallicus CBS 203.75]
MYGGQAIDRPDGRPTGLPPVFRGFWVRVREWQWDTTSAGDGQGPSQAPSRGNTDGENEVRFKDKKVRAGQSVSATGCVSAGCQWASTGLLAFTVGKPVCVKKTWSEGFACRENATRTGGNQIAAGGKAGTSGAHPARKHDGANPIGFRPCTDVGHSCGIECRDFHVLLLAAANALAAKPGLRRFAVGSSRSFP